MSTAPAVDAVGPESATFNLRLVASAVSGLAGSLLIVATSPVWHLAPPAWRFTLPGLQHPGPSLYSGVTFVIGVVLMVAGWIGLISHARRIGHRPRALATVVGVTVLWSMPMLVAPPQLSNDVYAYSAQGEMAANGIDPSAHGPDVLRGMRERLDFWRETDPVWRDAPAPYGPVAVASARAAVEVTGHDAATSIWAFRALAVAGVVLAGIGVVSIARSRGVNPAVALAVGIANPLVVLHLIGGSHNDAGMMGLLLVGIAANERGRKVLAVVLVTLAAAVKLPAVLGLVFIGWNWLGADARFRDRVRSTALAGAGAAGLLVALSLAVRIGIGWLTALQNTGKIMSTFSVSTKVGFLGSDVLDWVGLGVDEDLVVAATRLAGMAVAGLVVLWLLHRSTDPDWGIPLTLGLSLLVVMLLGPVVWPWYLPVGFALLAAGGVHRFRPTMIVLVIASCLLVFPTSVSPINELSRWQHWLGLGVLLLVAAACVAAQYGARAAERWRFRRGTAYLPTDPAPDSTAVGAGATAPAL